MIYRIFTLALAVVSCASFQLGSFTTLQTQHQSSSYNGPRKGYSLYMGGAKGVISTQAGKAVRVESIVEDLKKSTMIAKAFNSGLTVKQMSILRSKIPESTKISVIKNTLMRRALEDVPEYGVIDPTLTTGSNMWFFMEDDIKGTLKAYKKFLEAEDKDLEVYDFQGGCIDGELLDASGVLAVSKLPSKLELYATIAGLINAVPTKLARSVNAVPQKLAVAINLALVDGKEEGESAE